jgi:hypothetical protein
MKPDSRIHIVNIDWGAARRNCRKISCRPDFQNHILGRPAHRKFSWIIGRYQPPFMLFVAHRKPAASVVALHRTPFTKSSEGSTSSRSATESLSLVIPRPDHRKARPSGLIRKCVVAEKISFRHVKRNSRRNSLLANSRTRRIHESETGHRDFTNSLSQGPRIPSISARPARRRAPAARG